MEQRFTARPPTQKAFQHLLCIEQSALLVRDKGKTPSEFIHRKLQDWLRNMANRQDQLLSHAALIVILDVNLLTLEKEQLKEQLSHTQVLRETLVTITQALPKLPVCVLSSSSDEALKKYMDNIGVNQFPDLSTVFGPWPHKGLQSLLQYVFYGTAKPRDLIFDPTQFMFIHKPRQTSDLAPDDIAQFLSRAKHYTTLRAFAVPMLDQDGAYYSAVWYREMLFKSRGVNTKNNNNLPLQFHCDALVSSNPPSAQLSVLVSLLEAMLDYDHKPTRPMWSRWVEVLAQLDEVMLEASEWSKWIDSVIRSLLLTWQDQFPGSYQSFVLPTNLHLDRIGVIQHSQSRAQALATLIDIIVNLHRILTNIELKGEARTQAWDAWFHHLDQVVRTDERIRKENGHQHEVGIWNSYYTAIIKQKLARDIDKTHYEQTQKVLALKKQNVEGVPAQAFVKELLQLEPELGPDDQPVYYQACSATAHFLKAPYQRQHRQQYQVDIDTARSPKSKHLRRLGIALMIIGSVAAITCWSLMMVAWYPIVLSFAITALSVAVPYLTYGVAAGVATFFAGVLCFWGSRPTGIERIMQDVFKQYPPPRVDKPDDSQYLPSHGLGEFQV